MLLLIIVLRGWAYDIITGFGLLVILLRGFALEMTLLVQVLVRVAQHVGPSSFLHSQTVTIHRSFTNKL